ncbi:YlbL family protein [Actinomadura parmotrematis]|uniref:endopeptidase La n=1 Tax=Actinomadura parmotrematis TaxID=2864039 RepID=A0ABS7G0R5_9ACTN|nr:PDZ domain-containing protein [Actinomadura parmotrematis]MBW8486298.1 PDZ domain-containing protein [Actinomadura parmotrematis]
MSRRTVTLTLASVLVLAFALVGSFLPVPYVALMPGPTSNTLGVNARNEPLIKIEGRPTYPDQGHLNFTTVTYRGGLGNRIDLFTALRGWIENDVAIVPEETLFPKNESQQQVDAENTRQMQDSQQNAEAAALKELGIAVGTEVTVDTVQQGKPAAGKLKPGDRVVAVDGTEVTGVEQVTRLMGDRKPGTTVKVEYQREGRDATATLTTVAADDDPAHAVIGIVLGERYSFPFKVDISVGDVGGPSAGLMFSLAIVDKLTPQSLTGGRFIAGTGTITPEGKVGPIGGIQQKMVAARRAGATIFLTPKDNCADAAPAAPKGLRLVRADTLHDARQALESLNAGKPETGLPTCTAP